MADDDVDTDRQRLRRRPRGRADLRVPVRPRSRAEAGAAAVAVLDDQARDPRGLRAPAAGRGDEVARGGRALALRGGLARGHERHARRVGSPARRVRRRGLARPRADAHARPGGAPRGGDPQLRARAVLARRGALRGRRASAATPAATSAGSGCPARTRRRRSSTRSRDQAGEITKLEKSEEREQPQLLYDLTSLQRHANSLYGFSARRTLAAAQRLYEEHKALTYPRTNSRFLTGDMVAGDQADGRAGGPPPALRNPPPASSSPGVTAPRPRCE